MRGRSRKKKPDSKHTHLYKINMTEALRFLGIFFISVAVAKLAIGLFLMWRRRDGKG